MTVDKLVWARHKGVSRRAKWHRVNPNDGYNMLCNMGQILYDHPVYGEWCEVRTDDPPAKQCCFSCDASKRYG